MSEKKFYSVAKGLKTGIFTEWSLCEQNVHRVQSAVFKGFKNINQAANFLIIGGTFPSCKYIPVYDGTDVIKTLKDYSHECVDNSNVCTIDNCGVDSDPEQNDLDNLNDIYNKGQTLEGDKQTTPKVLESETVILCEDEKTENGENNVSVTSSNHELAGDGGSDVGVIKCTKPTCNLPPDKFMMLCSKCKNWTHYLCTKLPVYQLYTLTSTSRKYTCETCTVVPNDFVLKWTIENTSKPVDITVENNQTFNKTNEIVTRLEKSMVDALTHIYNSGKDEMITQLKQELELHTQIENKLDGVVNKVAAESETKYSKQNEKLNSIDKQVKDIRTQLDTLSRHNNASDQQLKTVVASLNSTCDNVKKVTVSLNDTCDVIRDSTELFRSISPVANRMSNSNGNTMTSTHHECNKAQDLPSELVQSEEQMNSVPNVSVQNRFAALRDHDATESKEFVYGYDGHEDLAEVNSSTNEMNASKKVLIMGNSHVKKIYTDNFLQGCIVDKLVCYSCSEVSDKMDDISQDYDAVFIHMFTNDVRETSPECCVETHVKLVETLKTHCKFAKIIVSLPFLTVKDKDLNLKIEKCQVMMKYEFLNNQCVQICETAALYDRGNAVWKFFIPDGIHLSNEGIRLFVSNMKRFLSKSLELGLNRHARSSGYKFGFSRYNQRSQFDDKPQNGRTHNTFEARRQPPRYNRHNSFNGRPHNNQQRSRVNFPNRPSYGQRSYRGQQPSPRDFDDLKDVLSQLFYRL